MSDPQPTGVSIAAPLRRGAGVSIGIEETARLAGLYRWCELQLFEVTGRRAVTVPEPAVKRVLGAHSSLHAWHADLWADRLPELHETGPDRLTRPVDDALAQFAAAVAAPDGGGSTIGTLVGVYRVFVPHVATAYRRHLGAVDGQTDAPTARTLTLVLRDLDEQWHEGEALLQSLLRTPAEVARAATRLAELESAWVGSQGLAVDDPADPV
jgi:hypothetical protein